MCIRAFYWRGHISSGFCRVKMPPEKWPYPPFFILDFWVLSQLTFKAIDLHCLFKQNWFWMALKTKADPVKGEQRGWKSPCKHWGGGSKHFWMEVKNSTKGCLPLPFLKRVIKIMPYKNSIFISRNLRKVNTYGLTHK